MDRFSDCSQEQKWSILLIEDEANLREQLQFCLTQEGYRVYTAKDGLEALGQLQDHPVDLIIADITMPRMDGYKFCAEVRKNRDLDLVPLIFLTAKTSRTDRIKGRQLGADDFLGKPFELDELLEVIRTRLTRTQRIAGNAEEGYAARVTKSLSHEFRTPLTIIHGMASVLSSEEGLPPATQKEFLRAVQENSRLLNRLIDNFLHVARTESGSYRIEKKPLPLSPLITTVVASYQEIAAEKSIALESQIPSDLPTFDAHRESVLVLLSNLVDNAIKFTPRGGIVKVRASATNTEVRIRVEDTGIGVRKENRSRVFDKFFREDMHVHTNPGAGLGLTIARQVVLAHGGSILFSGEPGQGSQVDLRFPLPEAG